MKTQKIVLALALAVVTPAVLSAQEYTGPGSKIGYITDSTLNKIRQNSKQKQEPSKTDVTEPENHNTQNYTSQADYVYIDREGHMMALANLGKKPKNNQKETKAQKLWQALKKLNTHKNNQKETKAQKPVNDNKTSSSTSTYNPYVGPEGHRAALGNAVRDARRDSTPTHVQDADALARNHQVTLDERTADKSTKKTNSGFRQLLREVGEAIAQEAPFMK